MRYGEVALAWERERACVTGALPGDLAGFTTPHALILSPRFWGSGWHPGNLVRHAMRRAGWRGSSNFLRRRRELACRIASPPSACHPKSCPPAPLGRASCLRAPDPWRPVRLRAGMAQMRPVGGRYLHRFGAGHSRRGRYLRERGKSSREKLPESSHFSVWFFGGEDKSFKKLLEWEKSERRFIGILSLPLSQRREGGQQALLEQSVGSIPPITPPPPPFSFPPCPSKETLDSLPPPPLFFPGPRYR